MEIAVRGFLIDDDERILLVKHASDQPRVLPGGHLEDEDDQDIYACLQREIREELWLDITMIWAECTLSEYNVVPLPLPISIHKVQYEHRTRGKITKLEYRFFARVFDEVNDIDNEEIYDYQRVTGDELLTMDTHMEIHTSTQEIFEQNIDLLELI